MCDKPLFWKDASDRTVRTISVHDDVELSPIDTNRPPFIINQL
jgi:hypothetical protein